MISGLHDHVHEADAACAGGFTETPASVPLSSVDLYDEGSFVLVLVPRSATRLFWFTLGFLTAAENGQLVLFPFFTLKKLQLLFIFFFFTA